MPLNELGVHVAEYFSTGGGYVIVALVCLEDEWFAVEIDGPSDSQSDSRAV